jgi:hypothetical protein
MVCFASSCVIAKNGCEMHNWSANTNGPKGSVEFVVMLAGWLAGNLLQSLRYPNFNNGLSGNAQSLGFFIQVKIPDQYLSAILPIIKNRGSSTFLAGISTLSGSSHIIWASIYKRQFSTQKRAILGKVKEG